MLPMNFTFCQSYIIPEALILGSESPFLGAIETLHVRTGWPMCLVSQEHRSCLRNHSSHDVGFDVFGVDNFTQLRFMQAPSAFRTAAH